MARCADLLEKARAAPKSLRFAELRQLAECFGWEYARQEGSHVMYKRQGSVQLMNFQDANGDAKPYQVRQLLWAIDDLGLTAPEDGEEAKNG